MVTWFKMRIVSWNINGIRSMKEIGSWHTPLESTKADIICLQETKITRDLLEESIALKDGFNSYFAFSRKRSGYSGVATFCRDSFTPTKAEEGLAGTLPSSTFEDSIGYYGSIEYEFSWSERKELDSEGRSILTQHDVQINGSSQTLVIINVYCPALTQGDKTQEEYRTRNVFKMKFNKLLELRANALCDAGFHVMILGDLNISHKPIDHCNPSENFGDNPGRKWLDHFLHSNTLPKEQSNELNGSREVEDLIEWKIESVKTKSHQFVDLFRISFPCRTSAYTCWNTELNCRSTNYGTRIDYILMDIKLYHSDILKNCDIKPEVLGSDHCPVFADLNLKVVPSKIHPKYCTKYFPEFSGKQQKLSKFLTSKSNCDNVKSTSKDDFETNKVNCDLGQKPSLKIGSSKTNQKTISSYFIKQTKEPTMIDSMISNETSPNSSTNHDDKTANPKNEDLNIDRVTERIHQREKSSQQWKNLMGGRVKKNSVIPKCSGHREPCAVRKVRKPGKNLGKTFFACARGVGRAGDPQAQCGHFEWQ